MFNLVVLVGRLGSDPQYRVIRKGINGKSDLSLCVLTLCTNEFFKAKEDGNYKQVTTWHKAFVWSPLSERIKDHLKRGEMVLVMGKQKVKTYIDKEGVEKKFVFVQVKDIDFVGRNLGIRPKGAIDGKFRREKKEGKKVVPSNIDEVSNEIVYPSGKNREDLLQEEFSQGLKDMFKEMEEGSTKAD